MPTIPRPICSNLSRTNCSRSPRRERRALILLALVAFAAFGQSPSTTISAQAPKEPPACASVVVVRCERSEPALSSDPAERARQLERRRATGEPLELDRIVIEADPIGRSIEESMSRALGTRSSWGTRSYTTGEGAQCTCMNICPPWPFPCCQCSSHMRGYGSSPGSSPFN